MRFARRLAMCRTAMTREVALPAVALSGLRLRSQIQPMHERQCNLPRSNRRLQPSAAGAIMSRRG